MILSGLTSTLGLNKDRPIQSRIVRRNSESGWTLCRWCLRERLATMLQVRAAGNCTCKEICVCSNRLNQYYLAADIISHYCGGPWTLALSWFHWNTYQGYRQRKTLNSYEEEKPQEDSVRPTHLRPRKQQVGYNLPSMTSDQALETLRFEATMRALGRLRIRLALSGRTVCFPGPATRENDWSIPRYAFQVNNLVGHRVLLVNDDDVTLSTESHLVAAVHTAWGEVAPPSFDLNDTADKGWISVTLGEAVTPFTGLTCEERPREDGSDVPTPPTPRSVGCVTPR